MITVKLALLLVCFCLWRKVLTDTQLSVSVNVRQEGGFVSAEVGGSVTLKCFYEGTVAAMIFWYKQTPGRQPRLISSSYRHQTDSIFSDGFQDPSRFKVEAKNTTNHLTISKLVPSDSATYYCVSCYGYNFRFAEGQTVSVQGSGWEIKTLVRQAEPVMDQHGGSVDLSCTVHTGGCDGERSVYWVRNSEGPHPGVIYTSGGRNHPCERRPGARTCVYNLPEGNQGRSLSGTYDCAVATCGNILFGNSTKTESATADVKNPNHQSLVYVLSGGLVITITLIVALIIALCMINNRSCKCTDSQREETSTGTAQGGFQEADDLHYAALRNKKVNRHRKQREDTKSECVYSGVRQ